MPGMKGSIEALSRVQVPEPTPVSGRQQPVAPRDRGSRLSRVEGLRLGSAAAGLRLQSPAVDSGSGKIALAHNIGIGRATAAATSVPAPPFLAHCIF